MTSVIVEADRSGGVLPFDILFDQNDGATRIWMTRVALSRGAGLHRHEGDEIWRVRRGRIRMVVGEQRFAVGAGELVVIPPNTIHGIAPQAPDTEVEVIGELGMGEWITVLEADGHRQEVEVHMPFIPWHRPLPDGQEPISVEDMIAMMQSTEHLV
jgi:mannose-6-phosphate isomerase-like protein (cupin superfamily)